MANLPPLAPAAPLAASTGCRVGANKGHGVVGEAEPTQLVLGVVDTVTTGTSLIAGWGGQGRGLSLHLP